MAYCGPRGIPLSEFLQWHPDDQQAALAWQADQNDRCPGCGTADWEWEADRNAYTAEVRVCRGCNRKGSKEREAVVKDQAEAFPGLQIRLVPRELATST